MIIPVLGVIFVFGLCIGSFFNVLIDRIPNEQSVWRGRSHCDHCDKTLTWPDLVPVLSWLLLRGRCRRCHSPISIQYPIVELITGISFVLATLYLPEIPAFFVHMETFSIFEVWSYLYWLWMIGALIVIFFTDLKYGIIPDAVLFPSLVLAIFQRVMQWIGNQTIDTHLVITSLIGTLFFLFLHLLTKGKGMGFGDVKFVLFLGFLLGSPLLWVSLYTAFLTGGIAGVILILLRKKKLKQTIAFGPFLVLGALIALFFGDQLFAWWLQFIV